MECLLGHLLTRGGTGNYGSFRWVGVLLPRQSPNQDSSSAGVPGLVFFSPFGLAQAARPSLVNGDKVPPNEASSGATSCPGS